MAIRGGLGDMALMEGVSLDHDVWTEEAVLVKWVYHSAESDMIALLMKEIQYSYVKIDVWFIELMFSQGISQSFNVKLYVNTLTIHILILSLT